MRFKRVFILLLFLVSLLFLAGCGGTQDADKNGDQEETITLKYAHHIAPTGLGHLEAHAPWAELVEEKTDGKVKIQIHPAETLGKATNAYELVTSGMADIAWGFVGFFPGQFPLTEVIDLPMLGIDSGELGSKVLWDLYSQTPYLKDEYPGVKVLTLHTHDTATISSKKPINSEADIAGLKIRTPAGPPLTVLQELGASPMLLPAPEIYESADKGIIKGCALSWEGTEGFKLNEVFDYYLDCNFFVGPFWLVMNQKTWDSLPADVQEVFEEVSGEFAAEFYGKAWDKAEALAKEKIAESGGTIYELSPEELAIWQSKAEVVWEKWAEDLDAKGLPASEILEETQRLIKEYKG